MTVLGDEPADPDAPYGRKPDGTPYKVSPERRQELSDRMAAGRTRKAQTRRAHGDKAPPRRASGGAKPASKGPSRLDSAASMLQAFTMGLGVVGRLLSRPDRPSPFTLDSMTFAMHGPALAGGIADMANTDGKLGKALAKWLDRVGTIAPAAPLSAVALAIVGQVIVNHGIVKSLPGTMSPDELIDVMAGDDADGS